jgi:exopolyphosphatase/guanosine-5'-triphosphate,3'-diphosphate pyrophosphatase
MVEATDAGLREGVFFESLLGDPPLVDDVRRATVHNLAAQYDTDFAHVEHVARLSLELWDGLAAAGVHRGDAKERELLWATGMLHDIGTAIDYDDHHKHSRYLILSAGLPGYSPRETALIGQAARYHRKGNPGLGEFTALARDGDEAMLNRLAAAVRIAEQLERSRDQAVSAFDVSVDNGQVDLRLRAKEDVTVARWATERQGDVFRKAFGRNLSVT